MISIKNIKNLAQEVRRLFFCSQNAHFVLGWAVIFLQDKNKFYLNMERFWIKIMTGI